MQDPSRHCETLVREADKDRSLATLFAPAAHRAPLFALYAFSTELARVRERAREPMPGEIRLQWWREVLGGERAGEAEANPVAAALRAVVAQFGLPVQTLMEMLEARAFDLYDDPMGTIGELEGYAARTSSALMTLAARVLCGGGDPGAGALMRHAGIACSIAGLLEAFGLHASRRQLYLPLDVLRCHGAHAEDIFAARSSPELQAALADLRARARGHLAQAQNSLPDDPRALLPALLPAATVGAAVGRMERRNYDPFALDPLPPWRRQWLIWRAARSPARLFANA